MHTETLFKHAYVLVLKCELNSMKGAKVLLACLTEREAQQAATEFMQETAKRFPEDEYAPHYYEIVQVVP